MEFLKQITRGLVIIVVDFILIVFFAIVIDGFLLPYGLPFIDMFTIILGLMFVRIFADFKIYNSREVLNVIDNKDFLFAAFINIS